MNLIYLVILFVFGSWLWKKSGVGIFNKAALIATVLLVFIWFVIWGQIAVVDGWWFYNKNNIIGFRAGVVPIIDLLYFFAGIGWHLYIGSKLKIFKSK